jgi:hypothetical protein
MYSYWEESARSGVRIGGISLSQTCKPSLRQNYDELVYMNSKSLNGSKGKKVGERSLHVAPRCGILMLD